MTVATRNWEDQLRIWSHAPGQAEQTKMEATESQIRAAITASSALQARDITVAAQGSYRNLTHIPRESDVDIRVVCNDIMWSDFDAIDPRWATDDAVRDALWKRFDIAPAAYNYAQFRREVGEALVARFGLPPNVTAGDKAWGIRESRYNVDSDVVAVLPFRRYRADGDYHVGVQFITLKGKKIVNFPEQQCRNGVTKNQNTGERFKAMVRALKSLRNEMADQKDASADGISSFLIECLVWNVPNSKFNHASYCDDMKEILLCLYAGTKAGGDCETWTEESGLKWLFKGDVAWTREQVNAFVVKAWSHLGFDA